MHDEGEHVMFGPSSVFSGIELDDKKRINEKNRWSKKKKKKSQQN